MLTLFLTQMMTVLTLMFFLSQHPLALGMILILSSMIYGLMMYLYSMTPWLAYILIMVFLSGMMIIFIYMASLSSNVKMDNNMIKTGMSLSILTSAVVFYIMYKSFGVNYPNTPHLSSLLTLCWSNSTEFTQKTYSFMLSEMTLLLIIYLLVALIVAVKITSLNKGPLRSMN